MIALTVNGEGRQLEREMTVAEFLGGLPVDATRVAVLINDDVVPRATYGERVVRDGDRVELLSFAGGG